MFPITTIGSKEPKTSAISVESIKREVLFDAIDAAGKLTNKLSDYDEDQYEFIDIDELYTSSLEEVCSSVEDSYVFGRIKQVVEDGMSSEHCSLLPLLRMGLSCCVVDNIYASDIVVARCDWKSIWLLSQHAKHIFRNGMSYIDYVTGLGDDKRQLLEMEKAHARHCIEEPNLGFKQFFEHLAIDTFAYDVQTRLSDKYAITSALDVDLIASTASMIWTSESIRASA